MRPQFFLLFLLLSSLAHAQDHHDAIEAIIEDANRQLARKVDCEEPKKDHRIPLSVFETSNEIELRREIVRDHLGQNLPISVVAEEDLGKLKSLYPPNLRVYDGEVCAQRAHIIGDALAKKGIETQKLYLTPGGIWPFKGQIIPDDKVRTNSGKKPRWDYHVVNLIYVKTKSGRIEPYVIDPFMEGQPVPQSHWESRLRSNPNSSIGSQQIMSRYNFGPTDSDHKLSGYNADVLQRSYRIMSGDKSE